ncbi:hypothetical protein P186_0199 [Pyrobaculum ferrireducens]|uniref:Uncharacterized protein n=1 Tax=Pyrobaculum ferrireducens TaxID=1104324 RepID=G7VF44_9CREN|nr:hypothetical protein P186_0199 [Pyrobaculum ferrireducens]
MAVKLASGCGYLEFLISFSADASEVLGIDYVDVLIPTDDLPYVPGGVGEADIRQG